MGEGSQPMPWIHVKDLAGLVVHSVKMEDDILMFSAMKVIRRLTKQKDRVEFDNRDLIAGSEFAESLPGSLRVLGWYHSHPHITVHPSHVDLATQASYQTMDINFVGTDPHGRKLVRTETMAGSAGPLGALGAVALLSSNTWRSLMSDPLKMMNSYTCGCHGFQTTATKMCPVSGLPPPRAR